MSKLTVVITALNEGELLDATLKSIRETAGDDIPIIVVDDASDEDSGKEYCKAAGARYHRNAERQGVAGSRDVGVGLSETAFNLIIDGHMRFHHDDWQRKMVRAIEEHPRSLFCTRCATFDEQARHIGSGAYLDFGNRWEMLNPKWNRERFTESLVEISCVLGASYLISTEYYKKLRGLAGLQVYGMDETFLSLKVQLEGGRCRLINDLCIDHWFRKEAPYEADWVSLLYNKGYIIKTLLPDEMQSRYLDGLRRYHKEWPQISERLCENDAEIQEAREYFRSIQTREFEDIVRFNKPFLPPLWKRTLAWMAPRKMLMRVFRLGREARRLLTR